MDTSKAISGEVVSVNISTEKGVNKRRVAKVLLKENFGIEDDAHAGTEERQVSLLAMESIEKSRKRKITVNPGDFAENITTKGIDLVNLPLGTRLLIGSVILEVTKIGKICHSRCGIFYKIGDCIMPREGIFAKVIHGGEIEVGDRIRINSKT